MILYVFDAVFTYPHLHSLFDHPVIYCKCSRPQHPFRLHFTIYFRLCHYVCITKSTVACPPKEWYDEYSLKSAFIL